MKRFSAACLFLLVFYSIHAQSNADHTMPLGYGGVADGIEPELDGMLMHFGEGPAYVTPQTEQPMPTKPIAFICDSTGSLQLYFNGCTLVNGQHQVIENSDSIDLGVTSENISFCQYDSTLEYFYQNALLLLLPGSDHIYYLFTLRNKPVNGINCSLFYSVIDMSLNGGAGKVILKNHPTQTGGLSPVNLSSYISAVRHGNGRDWWIVCPTYSSARPRLVLLLSPAGVKEPFIWNPVGSPALTLDNAGQIGFTGDGRRFFRAMPGAGVELLDFNRCTGQFSNVQVISNLPDTAPFGDIAKMGLVSSPNGQFLYVSTGHKVFQFDLSVNNIEESRKLVGTFDGFISGENPATFYQGFCAADGKIYFAGTKRTKHLHVVQQPNLAGLACQFEQHAFPLPAYQSFILPNFPNFRLLDLQDSPCDTLGIDLVNVQGPDVPAGNILRVDPNPSAGQFQVYLPADFRSGTVQVYNAAGQPVFEENISQEYTHSITLDRQPNGLYWIILQHQDGRSAGYSKIMINR